MVTMRQGTPGKDRCVSALLEVEGPATVGDRFWITRRLTACDDEYAVVVT